ncbi:MAG: hypothetical protein VKJ24_16425 [Synechococcales bacterium]|nr:hypothetical protein [Synechococcales bacterium]
MHDNKLRLSSDVIEKAQMIAEEWGLKNARAAIEAVFRKYADDYLYGRQGLMQPSLMQSGMMQSGASYPERSGVIMGEWYSEGRSPSPTNSLQPQAISECEAVHELDGILGL